MFLGAGGAGKTSLLDGLMDRPLKKAESTVLADTKTVSYQWVQAADMTDKADDNMVDGAWNEYTSRDEELSLAIKCDNIKNEVQAMSPKASSSNGELKDSTGALKVKTSAYSSIAHRLVRTDYTHLHENKTPDAVMHVWDCGGQPVFLDILAAFLTQRTMFIFVFDASIPLDNMFQEKWHHNGEVIEVRKQHVTNLQLMMQWLQLVHSSLVVKSEGQPTPSCPRAMIVGTHRDKISSDTAEYVKGQLQSDCSDAMFGDIVVHHQVVDNTKAGRRKEDLNEDPGYREIRNLVHRFAQSLIVPTPLSWVVLRQALQKLSKPVLTYSEVCDVAKKHNITEPAIKSFLAFFHQLGALLHYDTISSLADTVIIEPQWLIKQLRLLLMPEFYGHRPAHLKRLWGFLEEKGVLLEELCSEIWKECGLSSGPQALVDLLEHFDLAVCIQHCPDEMSFYKGKKYYFPCMLQGNPKLIPKCSEIFKIEPNIEAAMLRISFNTSYVPPGFFVRLIANIVQKGHAPLLDREITFRNGIVFQYGEIDQFSISESLNCLSIVAVRISNRKESQCRFSESCNMLRNEVSEICSTVLQKWMPSVTHTLAYKCTNVGCEKFVPLKVDHHCGSTFVCSSGHKCDFSPEQKFWLNPHPVKERDFSPLTEAEMMNLSNEIKEDNFTDLVKAMEMEHCFEEAKSSVDCTNIVEYVLSVYLDEGGTRHQLARFLKEARFVSLSTRLLKGSLDHQTYHSVKNSVQETPHEKRHVSSYQTEQTQHRSLDDEDHVLSLESKPEMLQLISFPSNPKKMDIIQEICNKSQNLGIVLLNDKSGAIISSIESDHRGNPYAITREILKRWLQGEGKHPVTWKTLVVILEKLNLKVVAKEVLEVAMSNP